jgi:hypothetical protein
VYVASSAWYESATVWAAVGVLAVIAVGIATILVTYNVAVTRQRLTWTVASTSLLGEKTSYGPLLKVTYNDQKVGNPTIVTIVLNNIGRKDIPSSSFDGQRGIIIDVKAHIVAELPARGTPLPDELSWIEDSRYEFRPWLIRAGSWIEVVLLVDGAPGEIDISSPLIDVDVIKGPKDLLSRTTLERRCPFPESLNA